MTIDHSFVDIDLEQEADKLGKSRGWIEQDNAAMSAATTGIQNFEDVHPLLPESQWKETAGLLERSLRNCVRVVLDQKKEGSCHTPDTEVLTTRGWIPWSDYGWVDPLATMNMATGFLEFQSPLQRHVYDYDGDMVYSSHRRLDFAVTADHRMLVNKWQRTRDAIDNDLSFVEAGRIGWYAGLPAATTGWVGTELVKVAIDGDREYSGDDFAALMGIIVSDGWAGGTTNTTNRVSFCCFRPDRQQQARELAARTGFTEQPGRPGVWCRYGAAALAHWLRCNIYASTDLRSRNKRAPDIIKCCTSKQIELFLKFFGDQTHDRQHGAQLFTSSKLLADDLQELYLRVGKRASIFVKDGREAQIRGRSIHSDRHFVVTVAEGTQLGLHRKHNLDVQRYRGPVYCATVPNGTLVTRRHGKLLISGNCVGNATIGAFQTRSWFLWGQHGFRKLSPMSLYKRIGRSPQSGAYIPDAIDEMLQRGCLPLNIPENNSYHHVHQATGFGTSLPSGWQETGRLFRVVRWLRCNTLPEWFSALARGTPIVYGRKGHAIYSWLPSYEGNSLYLGYPNSWGQWGDTVNDTVGKGLGWDSAKLIATCTGYAADLLVYRSELAQP